MKRLLVLLDSSAAFKHGCTFCRKMGIEADRRCASARGMSCHSRPVGPAECKKEKAAVLSVPQH